MFTAPNAQRLLWLRPLNKRVMESIMVHVTMRASVHVNVTAGVQKES